MFKKIRIKNFRTHIDTTIDLSDLTLIIGANNSGKSNLLAGINHFSKCVSRAYPENDKDKKISGYDFFPHRHSLSKENEPMEFYCSWEKDQYFLEYSLILFVNEDNQREVLCKEKLEIILSEKVEERFSHGWDSNSSEMLLRTKISHEHIDKNMLNIIDSFFQSLSFAFYYNLQPSFLKGIALPLKYDFFQKEYVVINHINFCQRYEKERKGVNFAIGLGEQGHNFQELIKYVKKYEDDTYGRFVGYLKRFVKSFNSIVIDKDKIQWQFDMGNNNFPCYDAEKVSEGLLKAGAVALLCAMRTPPAIIMLEEVENGINQKNISEFLSWLKLASHNNNKTQFILTSHSPSVIREFNEDLDNVYKVDLKEKSGYKSSITKLSDALVSLISLGTIDEDTIIGYKEIDGKQIAQIRAYELTELFYNGVLGNL
jgi:AAA15 family ATPase/GTPase